MLLVNCISSLLLVFATGNIGYGKVARQSGSWTGLSAALALNGRGFDGTGRDGIGQCAHPDGSRVSPREPVAYWTVDLGKKHQILNVTIYNRHVGKCKLKLLYYCNCDIVKIVIICIILKLC